MLRRVQELELEIGRFSRHDIVARQFPDLSQLPPEIGLLVLSNLNATDLCLAACVWHDLGNDEILWHRLVSLLARRSLGDFCIRANASINFLRLPDTHPAYS